MIKLKKSATLANDARPGLLDRCILTILVLFIVLTSLPSQGILTSSTGNGLEEIRPTIASSIEKLDVVGSVDRPPPEIRPDQPPRLGFNLWLGAKPPAADLDDACFSLLK